MSDEPPSPGSVGQQRSRPGSLDSLNSDGESINDRDDSPKAQRVWFPSTASPANNLGERIKRTSMDWFERSSADGRAESKGSRKLAPFETMHEEEKKAGENDDEGDAPASSSPASSSRRNAGHRRLSQGAANFFKNFTSLKQAEIENAPADDPPFEGQKTALDQWAALRSSLRDGSLQSQFDKLREVPIPADTAVLEHGQDDIRQPDEFKTTLTPVATTIAASPSRGLRARRMSIRRVEQSPQVSGRNPSPSTLSEADKHARRLWHDRSELMDGSQHNAMGGALAMVVPSEVAQWRARQESRNQSDDDEDDALESGACDGDEGDDNDTLKETGQRTPQTFVKTDDTGATALAEALPQMAALTSVE